MGAQAYNYMQNINGGSYYHDASTQSSVVTLQGSVHLRGMESKTMSAKDIVVIQNSIAQELSEASALVVSSGKRFIANEAVSVDSWRDVSSLVGSDSRKLIADLETETMAMLPLTEVNFHIQVACDNYGVDGSKENMISKLASDLSAYLHHSMKSGLFATRLVSRARAEDAVNLQEVRNVKLLNLELVHKKKTTVGIFDIVVVVSAVFGGLIAGVVLVWSLSSKAMDNKSLARVKNSELVMLSETNPTELETQSRSTLIPVCPAVIPVSTIHSALQTSKSENF